MSRYGATRAGRRACLSLRLTSLRSPPPFTDPMSTATAAPSTCAACGEAASTTLKLQTCKACRSVAYCGRDCQLAHWRQHKRRCKAIKAERSAEVAERMRAAVYDQDLAGLKQLIVSEGQASLDTSDAEGWTALLVAASLGLVDFVVVLADNGASLDLANEDGCTPVLAAAPRSAEAPNTGSAEKPEAMQVLPDDVFALLCRFLVT